MTTLTHPNNRRLSVAHGVVKPEWIDINGHMNVAYYVLAFDLGVDELWGRAGITDDYIEQRKLSTFAVEAHITYQAELNLGDPFRVDTQILAVDEKRLHQFQSMYHADEGHLVATAEWLNLHVNLETRRVCPFPDDIRSAFIAMASGQSDFPMPAEARRRMNVSSPLYAIDGYHDERG